MKNLTLILSLFCFTLTAYSQIKTPQPSPHSTIIQDVGLNKISIDYSRPSIKGRTIFGDLVPFDELWRTGANASTDISFSEAVTFAGVEVEAGTYALYTIPGDKWTVILYKDADQWGAPKELKEKLIVAKAQVNAYQLDRTVETFSIGFDKLTNDGATLQLSWENTLVEIPIEVDTQSAVLESINLVMNGPTANDYFAAARYYFEQNIELDKAHDWVTKATDLNKNAYWMMKMKAEIEAKMGNYKEAIETATKAMEMAKKEGNTQYVEFNQKNIRDWSTK